MKLVRSDPVLHHIEQEVLRHAKEMNRILPEIRFYILDRMEFASLLEKHVFPTSPKNIWEGKRMVNKKYRIESGQESSLYYEVVQTGNPSYAYLNDTNSPMVQATVMAHVVGHCEFSELNVLQDSNRDRTEYVMYLVRKVNLGRQQMGEKNYQTFWNACESVVPLIAPHSQYNLSASVEGERQRQKERETDPDEESEKSYLKPFSHTMDTLLNTDTIEQVFEKEQQRKSKQEQINRKGFHLHQPCQDVFGFLQRYSPASPAERSVLDYLFTANVNHDFVIRTQIMNEGWAMYWEKKIMLKLFEEKIVKGIIDYARVFSGVCSPRPYYQRNPYHLGYNLWNYIEEQYKDGKISLEYVEESDLEKKENWKKEMGKDPMLFMEHLVGTVTDYEFLRRFLSNEMIEECYLNRIPRQHASMLGVSKDVIVRESERWIWVDPASVKTEMLMFFSHFQKPRIYLVDTDFLDGGLLLFHRNDGKKLRKDWIQPTLQNLNYIWKGPISLAAGETLYSFAAKKFTERTIKEISFETIVERMKRSEKPFNV